MADFEEAEAGHFHRFDPGKLRNRRDNPDAVVLVEPLGGAHGFVVRRDEQRLVFAFDRELRRLIAEYAEEAPDGVRLDEAGTSILWSPKDRRAGPVSPQTG